MKLRRIFVKALLSALVIVLVGNLQAFGAMERRFVLNIESSEESGLTMEESRVIQGVLYRKFSDSAFTKVYMRSGALEDVLEELRMGESSIVDSDSQAAQYVVTASVAVLSEKCEETPVASIAGLFGEKHGRHVEEFMRGAQWYYKGEYALSVMVINVATTEIYFHDTLKKSVSASDANADSPDLWQNLRAKAIQGAASEAGDAIRRRIKSEEERVAAFETRRSGAASPQKQASVANSRSSSASIQPKPANFDPNSSDQARVINTYPISSGQANLLIIRHNAAYRLYSGRNYKAAFEAFSQLVDEYQGNYLAAYWAGESAWKMGKKSYPIAAEWYERALEINPEYEPARRATRKVR